MYVGTQVITHSPWQAVITFGGKREDFSLPFTFELICIA